MGPCTKPRLDFTLFIILYIHAYLYMLDCRTTYQQNLYVRYANMWLICTTNKAYSPDLHVFELQCNWVGRSDRHCPMSLSLLCWRVALTLPALDFQYRQMNS